LTDGLRRWFGRRPVFESRWGRQHRPAIRNALQAPPEALLASATSGLAASKLLRDGIEYRAPAPITSGGKTAGIPPSV
jgi:hypothetical protein